MKAKLFKLLCGYSEFVLANRAQGFLGFIGLAKEATWGTAVAATDYAEAFSESLTLAKDRYELKNIFGAAAEPDDAVGLDRVAGEIVVPGYPVILGAMLKGVMETTSITVIASGALWKTEFLTFNGTNFSTACPVTPYTFEIFRDVTSSHQYRGCALSRLQLSIAPNQPLRASGSYIGRSSVVIAKTTATFPGSPVLPFTFDTASVSVGGSANARMESFNLTIDNGFEGIPTLDGTSTIAYIRRRAPQTIRISGTYDFPDITEYNDFVNQTERAMNLTLTKANSFSLYIQIPRVVYNAFPMGIGGRERLTVNFEGTGRYHTGSAMALNIALTTTKSNF